MATKSGIEKLMSSDIAIRVENLSKRFRIGATDQRHDTLAAAALNTFKGPIRNLQRLRRLSAFEGSSNEDGDVIWALDNVSFEVKRGDVVGVIGRNGAGKSTLLKVLSQITEPTSGKVTLRGRVSSLLEVGTGFHSELTGRENVYLNGTILGMRKHEVDRKFDEIVDFSGVEKFLDTPVKRYSSGMRVRLAFSVAAHLEPEILLVDEVLAVGDVEFQRKCLGKMEYVANSGRTVLFVSHNLQMIASLCPRTMLLSDGKIVRDGPTSESLAEYVEQSVRTSEYPLALREDRQGSGTIRFTKVQLLDDSGQPIKAASSGQDVQIGLEFNSTVDGPIKVLAISIGFRDQHDRVIFTCPSAIRGSLPEINGTTGAFYCSIPRLPLPPGTYRFNLFSTVGGVIADWVQDAGTIDVIGGDYYGTGRLPPSSHKGVFVDFEWSYISSLKSSHSGSVGGDDA